jgi:uncharacterized protein YkuJ
MIIEPLIFFVLITAIISVSVALMLIISSYVNVFKKYNLLLKEEQNLELKEHKEQIEVLEDARKKAAKIIAHAHFVESNTKNQFQQELQNVSMNEVKYFQEAATDLLSVYKQELESLKADTIKIANNITKDIENNTIQELKDFKEILKKETYASQKIVEQKIEEEYAQTKVEIETYKQDRIKKVEDEIYNILQNVSTLVLGKAISLEDHEQIVIDALNKAKEEKVFE